jgi:hypothetical protein
MNEQQKAVHVFLECADCGYSMVDGACPNCINDGFPCDCGCQRWEAVYDGDYPLVDHWVCSGCGVKV